MARSSCRCRGCLVEWLTLERYENFGPTSAGEPTGRGIASSRVMMSSLAEASDPIIQTIISLTYRRIETELLMPGRRENL